MSREIDPKSFFKKRNTVSPADVMPFTGFTDNVFDHEAAPVALSAPKPEDSGFAPLDSAIKPNEPIEEVNFTWEPLLENPAIERQKREAEEREKERKREESERTKKTQEILENAKNEAEEILRYAQTQAEEMIETARRNSEEIEASAYHAGFEHGEVAGRQLGEQKIDPIIRSLRAAIENLSSQQDVLLHAAEEEIVRVAFLTAIEVIHREIKQDPEVVLDVVKAAIQRMQRATGLTVFVSPHDFKYIESNMELVNSLTETGKTINVEPDESIQRGGCRVTSTTGEVDATIDTMIAHLRNRIWEQE